MRYCQFCGTKLEDGQQCTCKGAQEAAAEQQRPAARKHVLTQEQKEEMQKTMSEAKESAKAAGKALWNSAKAYGSTFAESAQSAMSKGAAAQGTLTAAMYQKIMMAFGALQVLFFFILSYAKLDGSGSVVKSVARFIGIDVPNRLTGLTMLWLMNGCAEYGIPNADTAFMEFVVLFGVPVLCGVLLIVFNRKEKSGGMISSIVLSVVTLLSYLVVHSDLSGNVEMLGYKMGLGFGFVFLVTALQIAAAVMGHITGKKAQAAA